MLGGVDEDEIGRLFLLDGIADLHRLLILLVTVGVQGRGGKGGAVESVPSRSRANRDHP